MMRKSLICTALAVVYSFGTALAQPVAVRSEGCPVPADAAQYNAEGEDAADLNPWRETALDAPLFRDEAVEPGGLTLRIFVDPETGEALQLSPADECTSS